MDYSLAALKLFCGQLKNARQTSSPSAMTLGGILFQRAWLQGVLVSGREEGCFVIDDGSDVIELSLSNEFQQQDWKRGMYVMVIGVYLVRVGDLPLIKVCTACSQIEFQKQELGKLDKLIPFRFLNHHHHIMNPICVYVWPTVETQRGLCESMRTSTLKRGCDDSFSVLSHRLSRDKVAGWWQNGVHKIVDLSPYPDREAMWHLEVIEAYKLFYQPSVEE